MVDETLYWQVFWLALAEPFPSLLSNSGVCISNRVCGETFSKPHTRIELTATGIAPDLHRTSHFNSACAETNNAGQM
jgi:hypothetical protein